MKRASVIFIAMLAFVGVACAGATAHAASTFKSNDRGTVTLSKDDTHNGAFYATGKAVVIDGTINGDLYCGAQSVEINGTVNGDVICGAQTISISGTVGHDVRTVSQSLSIDGSVAGTVSTISQITILAKSSKIGGDVNGMGQNLSIKGAIGGDVAYAGQEISGGGVIKGDANLDAQTISLTGTPSVEGKLTYSSQKDLALDSTVAKGGVVYQAPQKSDDAEAAMARTAAILFLAIVVSTVLLVMLAPRYFERSYAISRKRTAIVALVGVAVVLGVPFGLIILALTVVLLPLAIIGLLGYMLIYMLALPFFAYQLGRYIFGSVVRTIPLIALAGAVLLVILLSIPFLNIFVCFVMLVFGSGSLVMTVLNGYKRPNYRLSVSRKKA